MPEGSSSEAPVTKPGPSVFRKCLRRSFARNGFLPVISSGALSMLSAAMTASRHGHQRHRTASVPALMMCRERLLCPGRVVGDRVPGVYEQAGVATHRIG